MEMTKKIAYSESI